MQSARQYGDAGHGDAGYSDADNGDAEVLRVFELFGRIMPDKFLKQVSL